LLADRMHLADREGRCFATAHAMAVVHYETELVPNVETN